MATRSGKDGLALAGRGLADTTRLASSPPDIWRDIAATNADEIGPALDALIALLQDLRRDLPDGDRLAEVFTDAGRWRASLNDKTTINAETAEPAEPSVRVQRVLRCTS